jgi:hypothetical protein
MRINADSEYGMALVRKGKALTVRENVFHRKRSTDFISKQSSYARVAHVRNKQSKYYK